MPDFEMDETGKAKRRIDWTSAVPKIIEVAPVEIQSGEAPATQTVRVAEIAPNIRPRIRRIRGGNGHKVTTDLIKLNNTEKDNIRALFVRLNGIFEDCKKKCTDYMINHFVSEWQSLGTVDRHSVFQLTGFVSYLHREVARGRFRVPDMPRYLLWLKNQYGLWSQYNSERYVHYREEAIMLGRRISLETQTVPQYNLRVRSSTISRRL